MYSVAVQRDFFARHFLVGGDWGPENEPHAHHYVVEVRLEGRKLNEHGYLVDICEIESVLDTQIDYYRDKTINSLPEFEGLNPSLEHFARILCRAIVNTIQTRNLSVFAVKIWENNEAWAEYRENL